MNVGWRGEHGMYDMSHSSEHSDGVITVYDEHMEGGVSANANSLTFSVPVIVVLVLCLTIFVLLGRLQVGNELLG